MTFQESIKFIQDFQMEINGGIDGLLFGGDTLQLQSGQKINLGKKCFFTRKESALNCFENAHSEDMEIPDGTPVGLGLIDFIREKEDEQRACRLLKKEDPSFTAVLKNKNGDFITIDDCEYFLDSLINFKDVTIL